MQLSSSLGRNDGDASVAAIVGCFYLMPSLYRNHHSNTVISWLIFYCLGLDASLVLNVYLVGKRCRLDPGGAMPFGSWAAQKSSDGNN